MDCTHKTLSNNVQINIPHTINENNPAHDSQSNQINCNTIHVVNEAEIVSPNSYVLVNLYSPILSAGYGHDILSEEYLGDLSIPLQLMQENRLKSSNLICLKVKGDSMQPKINDGAYIIINTSKKEIINNKIYAFNYKNVIRIKRLINNHNCLILRSENPNYSDEVITLKDLENNDFNLSILGQLEIIVNVE